MRTKSTYGKLIKSNAIRGVSAALIVSLGLNIIAPLNTSAMSAGAIISLTNQKRLESGLAPLNANWALTASASAKAGDMFANNYWSHTSPSGVSAWSFIGYSGYPYITAGENLAKDYQTEAGVVSGWMNSPTHRQNILNPTFRDIGVTAQAGTLLGAPTTIVVAHYGAMAQSAPVPPAPAPITPPPAAVTYSVPAHAKATPVANDDVAVPVDIPVETVAPSDSILPSPIKKTTSIKKHAPPTKRIHSKHPFIEVLLSINKSYSRDTAPNNFLLYIGKI